MKITTVILILLLYKSGMCQDSTSLPDPIQFSEVIISATKSTLSQNQLAQSVQSIGQEKIAQLMPQSTADLLQKTGNLVVQKSQQGGGSPILRGMEANRVLLVVDGVRMNNIIYRGGHLQNIITIDPNILDKVEVLFGPASSVYGSDALGGVIHMITKKPVLSMNPTFKSVIASRYSTVNNEKMIHYDGMYSGRHFGALFSTTYTSYGDLNSGRKSNPLARGDSILWPRRYYYSFENNTDVLKRNPKPWKQIASGFNQLDLTGKLLWQFENADHIFNFQYSTSSNIPRYDRLTDVDNSAKLLRNGDWYYGPQKRFLASYESSIKSTMPITYKVYYQFIEESRHNRRVGNYNLQNRIEKVDVFGLDLFHKWIRGKNIFMFGLDGQSESVQSSAFSRNLVTGNVAPLDTRYPAAGNRMNRLGIYQILTQRFSDQFSTQQSLRLGYSYLKSDFGNNDFFKFPFNSIKQDHLFYSINIGTNYNPTERSKIGMALATGTRVPNVDDLSKVFESVSGRIIVPNEKLKPESSISMELNGSTYSQNMQSWIKGSVYLTRLYNVITTAPFLYNGEDSIIYNGVNSIVLASQNNTKALITGANLDAQLQIAPGFHTFFLINLTRGRILKSGANTPLDHIPPLTGKFGIDYTNLKWRIEFNSQFNGAKKIEDYLLNAEDNEIYATPYGMPAWMIYNLYSSIQLTKRVKAGIALENILDTEYRVFASGINAPGRNLSVSVKVNF